MILPIERVRAAYERALALQADHDIACQAAAQALGTDVESVREAVATFAEIDRLRTVGAE